MTYQEKYQELFSIYEKTTKDLSQALEQISLGVGFEDSTNFSDYSEAHQKHRFAERNF